MIWPIAVKTKMRHLLIGLTLFAGLHPLAAQNTAFTYNGLLSDSGNPANGSYDLSFTLCNAATGGTVCGTLTNTATGVSNGLFAVTLDFGGVFNGSDHWLEIAARTNGGGAFATLSPRQPVLPAPYAIYSAIAGSAATAVAANTANAVAATNLSGTVPAGQLGSGSAGAGTALYGDQTYKVTTNLTAAATAPITISAGVMNLNAIDVTNWGTNGSSEGYGLVSSKGVLQFAPLPSGGGGFSMLNTTNINLTDGTAMLVAIAHGLGATPSLVRMVLSCNAGDAASGFTTGQEIEANYIWEYAENAPAFSVSANAADLFITYDGTTGSKCYLGKAQNRVFSSMNNFKLKVYYHP
jgi:hypothetical protein